MNRIDCHCLLLLVAVTFPAISRADEPHKATAISVPTEYQAWIRQLRPLLPAPFVDGATEEAKILIATVSGDEERNLNEFSFSRNTIAGFNLSLANADGNCLP